MSMGANRVNSCSLLQLINNMSANLTTVGDVKRFCQSMAEIELESLSWVDICEHLENLRAAKPQIEALASNIRDNIKDVLAQRDAIDETAEDAEVRLRLAIANNQHAFIPLIEGRLSVLVKTANMYNGFCMRKLQQFDDLCLRVSYLEVVVDELMGLIQMIAEGDGGDEAEVIQGEDELIQMAPDDEEEGDDVIYMEAAEPEDAIQIPEERPDESLSADPSDYIPEIDSIVEELLEHVPRIQAHDRPDSGRAFAENMCLIHGTSGRQY